MESVELGFLFTSFKSSAFLEALDIYTVDDEAKTLELFLSEQPLAPVPSRDWTGLVSAATKSGKAIERVQLISGPLTPNLRYEFEWCYTHNVVAGERIYILEHANPSNLFGDLPQTRLLVL